MTNNLTRLTTPTRAAQVARRKGIMSKLDGLFLNLSHALNGYFAADAEIQTANPNVTNDLANAKAYYGGRVYAILEDINKERNR